MADNHIIQRKTTDEAFQLSVELNIRDHAENTVQYNSILVYRWLKDKYRDVYKLPYKIPPVFSREKLDIFYRENQHFCCRFEHSDQKFQGREWITEIEIITLDNKVLLGVKVSYTTPEDADYKKNIFSVPTVVRKIFSKNGCRDVRELNKNILEVDSDAKLIELHDLIVDQSRIFPVIVVSGTKDDTDGWTDARIFTDGILYKLGRIAHVAYIPNEMCFKWKELVGKGWDVYNGAVRTYYKNVDFDNYSDCRRHPLLMAQDKSTVLDLLVEKIRNNDMRVRLVDWKSRGHKFFAVARAEAEWARIKADAAKIRSSTEKEWTDFCAGIIEQSEKELADAKELSKRLEDELSAKKNQIYALQNYIESLQCKLADAGRAEEIIPAESECTYKYIPEWVDTHFPTTLYLTPRAKRNLKKARYKNIRLVYEALKLLGTDYWQMRNGLLEKAAVEQKFRDIGIMQIDEKTISESRAGERDDAYYVNYKGTDRKLEFHLKKGVDHDEENSLRIYYFWDDDNAVTVIGDLPGHLETRNS